jgi:hypothetical protein
MGITKLLDPRIHISNWMDKVTTQKDTSLAPTANSQTAVLPESDTLAITDERGREAEVVSGHFVPDQVIAIPANKAEMYTEQLRQTIQSFNEDKMTPMKWVVVKFFEFLSYTAPILVAFVVGSAIGSAWAGPFNFGNPWAVYSYVISIVLELMLPALGYACTVVLKQTLSDRSKVGLLIGLAILFLLLATGNSFATMFLLESHIDANKASRAALVSMYFRSFTPMTVDIISTIFLGVAVVKSFQKFLRDKQQEAAAVRSGAEANIAVDEAFQAAARRKDEADTMQEFYRIQNQKLLQDARSKLLDEGGTDSNRKGRYGGGW